MIELDEKKRIIQEFVPGKQVTLAHVIAICERKSLLFLFHFIIIGEKLK